MQRAAEFTVTRHRDWPMKRRGRDSLPATQGRTNSPQRNRPTVRQHGSFFLCRRPRTSWASRSGTDEKSTEGEGAVHWNRRHGGRQSVGVSALPSHDYAWLRALYAAADVSSSRRTVTRARPVDFVGRLPTAETLVVFTYVFSHLPEVRMSI